MARGRKIVDLAFQCEQENHLLFLPKYETTKGTASAEQQTALNSIKIDVFQNPVHSGSKQVEEFPKNESSGESSSVVPSTENDDFSDNSCDGFSSDHSEFVPDNLETDSSFSEDELLVHEAKRMKVQAKRMKVHKEQLIEVNKLRIQHSSVLASVENVRAIKFSAENKGSSSTPLQNATSELPTNDYGSESEVHAGKSSVTVLNVPEAESIISAEHRSSTPSCDSSIRQKRDEKSKKKKWVKVARIPDLCYFCESEVLNFARHISRNHSSETEVQKIFSFPAKDLRRQRLIATLRKKGNHLKNLDVCVKPVKKTHVVGKQNSECIPCKHCFGYYRPRQLWRHVQTCPESKGQNTQFSHQSDSQNLLVNHLPIDNRLRETVFPGMMADKVSLVAKRDLLICKFGARYLNSHREKHLINVCSRKMRELAKILIEVKKLNPLIKNLYDALQPVYFDLFVQATKIVAKFDPIREVFESPTFAMNIQTSLKQCCDIAVLFALKRKYHNSTVSIAEAESNFKTLKQLLEDAWRFEISTVAASDLSTKKWNKLTILPLATDLKTFRNYLLQKANEALETLETDDHNINAYKLLMETIFCRVLLLNRKRVGEMQRMPLHVYENAAVHQSYEEFNDAINPTERILLTKFKRVVIRGKRGRGVPVLFSTDLQQHVKVLIDLRQNFVQNLNIYLFPKLNTPNPITGYQVMQKHARLSKVKNPDAITSTRLRKHLATLTQIFNMSSNDIEQLATFMGHTSNVHKQVYRLPDDVYQTAKISKLLMLMEKGEAGEFKGKALDEIEINLEDEIIVGGPEDGSGSENEDQGYQEDLVQETPAATTVPRETKKARTLIPWTEEQKKLTRSFFEHHIKSKVPAKKGECDKLKNAYPGKFDNKTWQQIKVFVQNIYRKE